MLTPDTPALAALPTPQRAAKIYGYRLVKDGSLCEHATPPVGIASAADVHAILGQLAAVEVAEVLWVLPLDTRHRLLEGPIVVARGTLDHTPVHPREVFLPAIVQRAHSIILAHNHPSGDPTPSAEDVAITRQIQQAGTILGVPVLDHIIVTAERYVSLAEQWF